MDDTRARARVGAHCSGVDERLEGLEEAARWLETTRSGKHVDASHARSLVFYYYTHSDSLRRG